MPGKGKKVSFKKPNEQLNQQQLHSMVTELVNKQLTAHQKHERSRKKRKVSKCDPDQSSVTASTTQSLESEINAMANIEISTNKDSGADVSAASDLSDSKSISSESTSTENSD